MTLGLPFVNITFEEKAISAMQRNERGIIAIVLEDTKANGVTIVKTAADIPSDLSAKNKELINLALVGGTNIPDRIYLSVVGAGLTIDGVEALELKFFNWLATPHATTEQKPQIVTFIDTMRSNGSPVKYCVSNLAADKAYVVNYTIGGVKVGAVTYTADEFTCRIAGLLAGTPLNISTTYQPLHDVLEVQAYTKDEIEQKIGDGEFVIYHDGRKVKVARGVTSLTTISEATPASFKKIKVLSIADVMRTDIANTIEDNYIGKYANSYDNKMLVVTAIRGYLEVLARENLLDITSINTCEIDLESQILYLKSIGVDVDAMNDYQVQMYNTHDKIFLSIRTKILDAIEEVSITINI